MRTFAEQSCNVVFTMFFTSVKTIFLALIVVVAVLVAGQSTVAPVSVNLLTSYAMEYAVNTFKPYRHLFPEPYLIDLNNK